MHRERENAPLPIFQDNMNNINPPHNKSQSKKKKNKEKILASSSRLCYNNWSKITLFPRGVEITPLGGGSL
jgi:hypothetical protein